MPNLTNMELGDLKLYCLNITSFTISMLDWLKPFLKITLLILTIGYTVHKWWALHKSRESAGDK